MDKKMTLEMFLHTIVNQTMKKKHTSFSLERAENNFRMEGISDEKGSYIDGIKAMVDSMLFHESDYELILSPLAYYVKIKKHTKNDDVFYKVAFEDICKRSIFNISVYHNGTMLMDNEKMDVGTIISILDEAYKKHCE